MHINSIRLCNTGLWSNLQLKLLSTVHTRNIHSKHRSIILPEGPDLMASEALIVLTAGIGGCQMTNISCNSCSISPILPVIVAQYCQYCMQQLANITSNSCPISPILPAIVPQYRQYYHCNSLEQFGFRWRRSWTGFNDGLGSKLQIVGNQQ